METINWKVVKRTAERMKWPESIEDEKGICPFRPSRMPKGEEERQATEASHCRQRERGLSRDTEQPLTLRLSRRVEKYLAQLVTNCWQKRLPIEEKIQKQSSEKFS